MENKSKITIDGKEIFANEAATLELTIDAVTQRCDENQEVLDRLAEERVLVRNAEVARQQSDAAQEYGEDMAKIMEAARRIGKGAKVPASDEKKLMDYSMEMYLAAKNLAMLNEQKKREKYKSLWEDEDETQRESNMILRAGPTVQRRALVCRTQHPSKALKRSCRRVRRFRPFLRSCRKITDAS